MSKPDGVVNRVLPVAAFKPHPQNYQQHDEAQIADLRESLAQFGQVRSIVVQASKRNGHYLTVAGHGIIEAARQEGVGRLRADVIPASWSKTKVLAYLAADNELARRGTPDEMQLAALVAQVQAAEGDVLARLAAGEKRAMDRLLALARNGDGSMDAEPQIDRAAELQKKWGTARGQLWELPTRSGKGAHRLLCGDSTVREDVEWVMGGEKAGAIVTDPPYAFGLSSTSSMNSKSGGWHDMMNNASWFADRYRQWNDLLGGDGPMWIFGNWRTLPILMRAAFDSKVGIESVMVWYKNWIGPGGPKGLRPTYELIALSIVGDYGLQSRSVEDFITVKWSSHKPNIHQAEKPTALLEHLIFVSEREYIHDPFCGSGTSIVAGENVARLCRTIEADEKWIAVALQRYLDAFGIEPRLIEQGNGKAKRKRRAEVSA